VKRTRYEGSQNSLVYGVQDRGSVPGRDRDFSLHHRVQTGSGPHPTSCPTGTGVSPRE